MIIFRWNKKIGFVRSRFFFLFRVFVDFQLTEYVVDPAEPDQGKDKVQCAAVRNFYAELVIPVKAVNTERDNREQERKSAACGRLLGVHLVAVVGETDEPVNAVNSERDDREQNGEPYVTFFNHFIFLRSTFFVVIFII